MTDKLKFIRLDCYGTLANFEMGPTAKKIFADRIPADRMLAFFEYMFDQFGCGADQILHVSSSFRYDLMTTHDLGFTGKAFIDRNHEPACDGHDVNRLTDFRQLADLVGVDIPTETASMRRGA